MRFAIYRTEKQKNINIEIKKEKKTPEGGKEEEIKRAFQQRFLLQHLVCSLNPPFVSHVKNHSSLKFFPLYFLLFMCKWHKIKRNTIELIVLDFTVNCLSFYFIFYFLHNICKIIKSKHQLEEGSWCGKRSLRDFVFWITLFISTTTLILWFMEGGGRKSFILLCV